MATITDHQSRERLGRCSVGISLFYIDVLGIDKGMGWFSAIFPSEFCPPSAAWRPRVHRVELSAYWVTHSFVRQLWRETNLELLAQLPLLVSECLNQRMAEQRRLF